MNEQQMPMSALQVGEFARVVQILPENRLRQRLTDLGCIEGTAVYCDRAGLGGNPVAYRIRGALIALRKEDSEKIVVTRKEAVM